MTQGIHNILVPTDFSEHAYKAFLQALDLAERFGARVHLLHVAGQVEDDAWGPLFLSPEGRALDERPADILNGFLEQTVLRAGADGRDVETVLKHSSAIARTIIGYADEVDAGLIVMGAHGQQGLKHRLLGSITVKVGHATQRPLWLVRDESSPAAIRRILVPVDFSDNSLVALPWAAMLAEPYGSTLVLLHVVEEFAPVEVFGSAYTASAELTQTLEKEAKKHIAGLTADLEKKGQAVESHVVRGYPPGAILDVASDAIDLVVMSSHGKSRWERFMLGSVTEKVVRGIERPLVILKAPIE